MFYASFVYRLNLQASAGDKKMKLMMKHASSGFEPATQWSEV